MGPSMARRGLMRAVGQDASDATSIRSIGAALRSLRDHAGMLRLLLRTDDGPVNWVSRGELGCYPSKSCCRSVESRPLKGEGCRL